MIEFKYRPDVDGLRAVAVMLVLLYHAGLGFPGGYIGVDVFFVISGFLITGLILKEQNAGTFSLANFWVRRIRRIIPAATVMVVAVLVVGFFLLLPNDYSDLGKSTIAQQLMFSNVYFWQNTGYFDGPADLKPLLHTWSLAVEEQFYLGYPLLLILLKRFRRGTTPIVLGLLALGSLVLSQYGVNHHPSATFFLLPTRAWELLIGGLICFMPKPTRITPWILNLLSWLSLAAIFAAGWIFTPATPFPGFSALAPCGATAVIIYANSQKPTYPATILSWRPVVLVGLLSYSLYLWHWPILALWKYWFRNVEPSFGVLAIGASFILAYLSRRFVETPFRRGVPIKKISSVVTAAAGLAFAIVSCSGAVYFSHGIPQRFHFLLGNNNKIPTHYSSDNFALQSGDLPSLGVGPQPDEQLDFVLWGDSHALAVSTLLDRMAEDAGLSGAIIARGGHPPLRGVWKSNMGNSMVEWNDLAFKFIKDRDVKNVLLVARWAAHVNGRVNGEKDTLLIDSSSAVPSQKDAADLFLRSLGRTLEELDRLGVNVWLMKQVPLQNGDPRKTMVRSAWSGERQPNGISIDAHRLRQETVNSIIDSLVLSCTHVSIVDPADRCFPFSETSVIGDHEGCFYADDDHLSPHGADVLLGPLFERLFSELNSAK